MSLPDTWQKLHVIAQAWLDTWDSDDRDYERSVLDRTTRQTLPMVSGIENSKWLRFCNSAGMTVYGAVALSWCEGASIEQVWEGWKESGFLLKPLPEYERPARFINPALLPQTNSLKKITEVANKDALPICAMIAALKEPLEFDLGYDAMESAPPQIAAFLKSRIKQKAIRTQEDSQLIEAWSNSIQGTEYET